LWGKTKTIKTIQNEGETMNRTVKLLLIAAVALSVALSAYAGNQPEKSGCKKGAEKMMKCNCFSKMNLTDKQKDEITAMKKAFVEQKMKQREEMSKLQTSIMEMINSDKPDNAAIEKKIDEQAKLWITGKKAMVEHMMKMKALLTPEQLKIWKEHMATCGAGCKDMHKHMMMKKGGKMGEGCKGDKHMGCKRAEETEKTDK
jgi:Spy/CpxP family protein refolding chaperone